MSKSAYGGIMVLAFFYEGKRGKIMAKRDETQERRLRSSDIDGRVRTNSSGQRVDMQGRNRNTSNSGKNRKKKKKKSHLLRNILVVLLVLILGTVAFAGSKLMKMDHNTIKNVVKNEISQVSQEVMGGYKNIALFGLDNRSNGNFKSGNSDTIIVASINNKTKEVRMVSVYRDSYLNIGDDEYTKCNAAYQKGGPEKAINMLNRNLDLDITDYVAVDWNALVKTIDLLGGVDIELTEEEAGNINGYIDEVAGMVGQEAVYPTAGLQTLNGVQATCYARIRYTDGWDYKRTERQRTVISKIVEKAKSANILTLNNIIDEVFPEISTSLSATELLSLAASVTSYELGENTGFPFEKHSMAEYNYILVPVNLDNNVIELHKFLFDEDNYVPSNTVQAYSSTIVNNVGQQTAD